MMDESSANDIKEFCKKEYPNIEVLKGTDGLVKIATLDEIDTVVTSVVGMIGLKPTIAAIEAKKDIALANKETLVVAGELVMKKAKENNVKILPVDSEHSAIFQSLSGYNNKDINKIILTASGGPFRGKTTEDLKEVTVKEALKHPKWNMGQKISIDSATLMNKGLEVIEAHFLFDTDYDNIEVVVHPQSIIHSMVEYKDASVIAQLGTPDMRLPIQYALYYPERRPLSGEKLDLFKLKNLTFEEPDIETFKGLKLAYEAMTRGGNIPVAFNAANEKAVALFLDRKIKYLEITDIIEETMNQTGFIANPTLDQILETEQKAYEFIGSRW
jgi:1-deoxy-D-xylulose-5-phosphate reductoisomerase